MSDSAISKKFGIIHPVLISSVEKNGFPTHAEPVIAVPKISEDVAVRPSM
jgi:hypothetical protein